MFAIGFIYFYFMCTLCFACMYVCLCEDVWSPRTEVTDSCEAPSGCWELKWDPLEEQPVLLTSEPSSQSLAMVSHLKNKQTNKQTNKQPQQLCLIVEHHILVDV